MYSTLFFDLDDTLYAASTGLWVSIRDRISLYMNEKLHIDWQVIPPLREKLYRQYGTTLRGLQAIYEIDLKDYLDFVHDVPLSNYLKPSPALRSMLQSYAQTKIIFTNADIFHAQRVIKALGIEDCFDDIIDVYAISPFCKPLIEAYQVALTRSGNQNPNQCVLIEDSLTNIATAKQIGFHTIHVYCNSKPADKQQAHASIRDILELPTVLPF